MLHGVLAAAFAAGATLGLAQASQRPLPLIAVEQVGGVAATLRCLPHEPCLATLPLLLDGSPAEGAVLATFRPGYAVLRVAIRDAGGRVREFAPADSPTGVQVALAGEGPRVVALFETSPRGAAELTLASAPSLLLRVSLER